MGLAGFLAFWDRLWTPRRPSEAEVARVRRKLLADDAAALTPVEIATATLLDLRST